MNCFISRHWIKVLAFSCSASQACTEAHLKLRYDLLALEGVQDIHQLKVWAITSKKVMLTVHLVAPNVDYQKLRHQTFEMLHHEHHITEMTLQIEAEDCPPEHRGQSSHPHSHAETHQH
jgi:cobalt-zinc-cadmium efflux system protein